MFLTGKQNKIYFHFFLWKVLRYFTNQRFVPEKRQRKRIFCFLLNSKQVLLYPLPSSQILPPLQFSPWSCDRRVFMNVNQTHLYWITQWTPFYKHMSHMDRSTSLESASRGFNREDGLHTGSPITDKAAPKYLSAGQSPIRGDTAGTVKP